jgi:hypothetical protein
MSVLHCVQALVGVLSLACAAVHAADNAAVSRIELEALTPWEPARRDSLPAPAARDAAALATQRTLPSFADDGLRARWWWGRGAFEVGAGADWLAANRAASAARPWSHVLGVRATLSDRSRVVYETESALPWRPGDSAANGLRTSRVALEFKSKPSPVSNLRDGLLRVQLSGDATVQFRPRSGGLQVMYRERF